MCKHCGIYIESVHKPLCICNMRCPIVIEEILKVCIKKFYYSINSYNDKDILYIYEPMINDNDYNIHYNCFLGILMYRYVAFAKIFDLNFKSSENYDLIKEKLFNPPKEMLTKYLYYTKMNLFYDKYKTTFNYYINNYFNVLFKFDLNRIQRNKIFL